MKNYRDELENKIRATFGLFLQTYGVGRAKELAENLVYQCEVWARTAKAKPEVV